MPYGCLFEASACYFRPVLIEVPHFASLRGNEREITILRSDNGQTWREHATVATEDAVQDALEGSFSGLLICCVALLLLHKRTLQYSSSSSSSSSSRTYRLTWHKLQ